MMTLKFKTGNAAFDIDGSPVTEAARILREIADRIESGRLDGYVFDINGNMIGRYTLNNR